jgi:hypothetical protein
VSAIATYLRYLCLASLLRNTMSSLFPEDEADPRALAAPVTGAAEPEPEPVPERTAHANVSHQTTVSEAHLMYRKYHRHHQSAAAEAKSHDHKEVPDFAMFHRVFKTGVSDSDIELLIY